MNEDMEETHVKCESCDKYTKTEDAKLDDDANWFCPECWKHLLEDES